MYSLHMTELSLVLLPVEETKLWPISCVKKPFSVLNYLETAGKISTIPLFTYSWKIRHVKHRNKCVLMCSSEKFLMFLTFL